MKRLTWLLIIAIMMSIFAIPASAAGEYGEAPMLAALVESGELPPVEERLPDTPRVENDFSDEQLDAEIGQYGGTLKTVFPQVNWNPDVFVGMTENILSMQAFNSDVIEPNLVEEFEISEDMTTYTFKLRKGLKWHNGVEVVMDDVIFTVENFIFNKELTPVVPAWMTVDGIPFEFTVIDDLTFQLKFTGPYGALTSYLSCSGFNGYADFIKPAYYLKPFHKDFAEECHGSLEAYYEFIKPFAEVIGYDDPTADGVWTYVFNQIDLTTWEITDPMDCLTTQTFPGLIDEDIPQLYPWVMVSNESNVQLWARNPYYHKVDADGNQLPYIDYVQNSLVENAEMVQMKVITGEVDFLRESATINNITLYREHEADAHIIPYLLQQGNTPADLYLNMNYGLNTDGTIKDDDASRAWQEVVTDIRFRKAIAMAIDGNEILDTIYNNLGKVRDDSFCVHDIDGANALLDEMGMIDVDDDGYRDTPSGLHFEFQIWNAAEANDILPTIELYVEYLDEIGIKTSGYTTEPSLLSTSQAANEIPARCVWFSHSILWNAGNTYDIGIWGPLWNEWFQAGCPEGEEAASEYLIPENEGDRELIKSMYTIMTNSVSDIVNEVRPGILGYLDNNCYVIRPFEYVSGVVVLNENVKNVATDVVTHSVNYYLEIMYFEQ